MGSLSFTASRRAAADVATSWRVLTDPQRAAGWLSLARDVAAEGPAGVGRRIRVRTEILGRPATLDLTVDRWDEPHRYRLRSSGTFSGSLDVRLSSPDGRPEDQAPTDLEATLELRLSRLVPVGRRALARAVERRLEEDADRLVALIEQEAARRD